MCLRLCVLRRSFVNTSAWVRRGRVSTQKTCCVRDLTREEVFFLVQRQSHLDAHLQEASSSNVCAVIIWREGGKLLSLVQLE